MWSNPSPAINGQAGGLTPNNMEGGSWKSLPLFVLQGLPADQEGLSFGIIQWKAEEKIVAPGGP